MTPAQISEVINMLDQANSICIEATIKINKLKQYPAMKYEGLPELLRAQMQNATSMVSAALKLWKMQQEMMNGVTEHRSTGEKTDQGLPEVSGR